MKTQLKRLLALNLALILLLCAVFPASAAGTAAQPAADAEAEFLTDEYFDAWYGGICTALEEYAG